MSAVRDSRDSAALRLARGAPLGVLIALYAVLGDAWLTAGLLFVSLLTALAVGPRIEATTSGQNLTGVVTTVFVFAATSVLDKDPTAGRLGSGWSTIAAAAILHAVTRLTLVKPGGGLTGILTIGLAALIACGQSRSGAIYPVAVAAYLLTAFWALRVHDDGRPRLRQLSMRSRMVSLAMPFAVIVMAWVVTAPLAPLQSWLQRKFELAYLAGQNSRIGFSDRMRLGAMERMLRSDDVVLRIYGPHADYLRGVVYDAYDWGRWTFRAAATRGSAPPAVVSTLRGRPDGEGVVEMRRVGGDPIRLFAPYGARDFATSVGRVKVDGMGVAFRDDGDTAKSYWFRLGDRALPPPLPPSDDDTARPAYLEKKLRPLVDAWTLGATTDVEKVSRISEHLQRDYQYALSVPRDERKDPLVDFLFLHKSGHCEYFASALAVLSRMSGVPARVVGGYRVGEYNTLGKYHVVRERAAHAWVEAYVDGKDGTGWRTFDPTPEDLTSAPRGEHDESLVTALIDVASERVERGRAWLSERSTAELWTGALVTTLVLAAFQWWRGGGPSLPKTSVEDPIGEPLPCLASLLDALESLGVSRVRSEPLEAFAGRIRGQVPDERIAPLLVRYAAFRYGGQGDGGEIAFEMDAVTAGLRLGRKPDSPVHLTTETP